MKRIVLTAAVLLAPILAFAQSKNYKEQILLDKFDKSSNTYSGRILVTYELCGGDARYGAIASFDKVTAIITFDNAKSSEDAKAQKQTDVDKILAEVAGDAELCPAQ
jgi:hypothetical protein